MTIVINKRDLFAILINIELIEHKYSSMRFLIISNQKS